MTQPRRKKALITGITGQDGSYLAEALLAKDYDVYGIIRRSSSFNTNRIDHIYQDPHVVDSRLHLTFGDLNDASSLNKIMRTLRPDEMYNLGAQSHVRVSFDIPEYTAEVTGIGTLRLLEAIRESGIYPKFYQASSSEMFGKAQDIPQKETTPFYPRSPYGVAKVFSYWIVVNYREAYNLFACNGILFNHESPRRGETFVSRKISKAAARIKLGIQKKLYLGNLDAKRDWGFAGDYVEAMWLMLQQEEIFVATRGADPSGSFWMKCGMSFWSRERSNSSSSQKESCHLGGFPENFCYLQPHYLSMNCLPKHELPLYLTR